MSGLVRGTEQANSALGKVARKELDVARAESASRRPAGRIRARRGHGPGGAARLGVDKLVKSMKMSAVTTGLVGAGLDFATQKLGEWLAEAKAAREEPRALARNSGA